MTRPMPGGRRRIDRVLAPDFLDEVREIPLEELRARRTDAEQEEADLSYLRRMLHGRIDLIEAELVRRDPAFDGGAVIDSLPSILGDEVRTTRGLGRHFTVEPSRVDEHRREAEAILADATISDIAVRSVPELTAALATLRAYELDVSQARHSVQETVDALSTELTRRYKDGTATVDALLDTEPSGP